MIAIIVKNRRLDLFENTSLEFVINSPAFVGGDIDTVLGSYQFPTNIPLTQNNKSILNYPDRIDNVSPLIEDEPCQVRYRGILLFHGLATVKQAGEVARIIIIIDSYKQLKTTKLSDLPIGVHNFSDLASILAAAKDSAVNPLDHDFNFYPVYNLNYFATGEVPPTNEGNPYPHRYQNYYDVVTQQFVSSEFQRSAMPFVRAERIFESIQPKLDFKFVNNFQTNDELKRLSIYNDHSIYNELNEWETSFDLSDHVPNISVAEFLKRISRLFCLGLFIDRFQRKIELLPLKDIVNQPFRHDWTKKALNTYSVMTQKDYPGSFGYKSDSDDMFERQPYRELTDFTEVEFLDDMTDPGLYYIRSRNAFHYKISSSGVRQERFHQKMFLKHYVNDGAEYDFDTAPLFQTGGSAYGGELQTIRHCPEVDIKHDTNKSVRFTIYRGLFDCPFASNNPTTPDSSISGEQYSLLWNGSNGMFETWWKGWLNFLVNKKEVEMKMNLSISDILNFNFKDKVKVNQNQYFVKQLKIQLTSNGLETTDVKLTSVL